MTSNNNGCDLIEFLGGMNKARIVSINAPAKMEAYCADQKNYSDNFKEQASAVQLAQLAIKRVGYAQAIRICSQVAKDVSHINYINRYLYTRYQISDAGPDAKARMLCDDNVWIPSSHANNELEQSRFINMSYLRRGVELHFAERGQYLTRLKYPISVSPYFDVNEDISSFGSKGHHDFDAFKAAVESYDPEDDHKVIKSLRTSGEVRHVWYKKVPNKRFESIEVATGSKGSFPVTIWGQF